MGQLADGESMRELIGGMWVGQLMGCGLAEWTGGEWTGKVRCRVYGAAVSGGKEYWSEN